jgi:tetratricopeptide (TPR) repeat protein
LKTDVDPGSARDLLAGLEAVYGALAQALPRHAQDGKIEVVVFERQEDYTALSWPERLGAGLSTAKLDADFERHPVAVLYDDPIVGANLVFAHELTHLFLGERFLSLPPWLEEGLAQYYSTVRVDGDRIVIGDWLPQSYEPFEEPPPLREILSARPGELGARDERVRFYAGAWRLCHLLATREPARLASFLDDLGRGVSSREAFQQRFGPYEAWLDQEYPRYPSTTLPKVRVLAYHPPPETPWAHRVMSDAEVHLLWARIRPWGSGTEAAVTRDLDEAVHRGPAAPEARYVRGKLDFDTGHEEAAARELDAALQARPNEPRYLYARLVVSTERSTPDEGTQELVERLARAAGSAPELDMVAGRYGLAGNRADEALAFAVKAIRADPTCWRCERTRSRILFLGQRYDEAVRAADRGLALVPEGETASSLRAERAFFARLRDTDRAGGEWGR